MWRTLLLFFMCTCLSVNAKAAPPLTQPQLTALIQKSQQQTQSFTCNFTQTTTIPLLETPIVSHGLLTFAKPDSIKWEYTAPFQEGFILCNKNLTRWVGDKGTAQTSAASQDRLGNFLADQLIMWVQFDTKRILEDYSLSVVNSQPLTLELTPKKLEIQSIMKNLIISFSDEGPASMVILNEQNGGQTRLFFFDTKVNIPLTTKDFQ